MDPTGRIEMARRIAQDLSKLGTRASQDAPPHCDAASHGGRPLASSLTKFTKRRRKTLEPRKSDQAHDRDPAQAQFAIPEHTRTVKIIHRDGSHTIYTQTQHADGTIAHTPDGRIWATWATAPPLPPDGGRLERAPKLAPAPKPYEIKTGEIVGYRCWKVTMGATGELEFNSMFFDRAPWIDRVMHDKPAWSRRTMRTDEYSGVYAWKTRARALSYGTHFVRSPLDSSRDEKVVVAVGEVDLWGDVVEHADGYRGQHAKIGTIRHVITPRNVDPAVLAPVVDALRAEMAANGIEDTPSKRFWMRRFGSFKEASFSLWCISLGLLWGWAIFGGIIGMVTRALR